MSRVDFNTEAGKIEKYLSDLEAANRRLTLENSQLRASHSYRLGLALVSFAKRRKFAALGTLYKEVKLALKPQIAHLPEPQKRPAYRLLGPAQSIAPDFLQKVLEQPTIGSAVENHVKNKPAAIIAGIMGGDIRTRLGNAVAQSTLPYDRYDATWRELGVTHLVIEVDQLPYSFGWEHAFTLRDPAATVEMALMLQKAKAARITTVLISPSKPYKYPLLSRVRPFFDKELKRVEVSSAKLLAPARAPRA